MKFREFNNAYSAFVFVEIREYNANASDICRDIAKLLEPHIRIGLVSSMKEKPFAFINCVGSADSVFVYGNTRGYSELCNNCLAWATVAKTGKGLRATSCGSIGSEEVFYKLLDKYSLRDAAEEIVEKKNAEIEENEMQWQKFQQEQAAKKEAAIARANELSGGYREVITYQRSTYGGAFSATYYVERTDMTLDEFKEFITCLGHNAEAKPCNIPIKPEMVEIKQTNRNSWSYNWTGEWDD